MRTEINEPETSNEADNYEKESWFSENFEKLGITFALTMLVTLIILVSTYDFRSVELPKWLSQTLKSDWFWIGLGIFLLLVIFRPKLFKKQDGSSGSDVGSNVFAILLLCGLGVFVYYQVTKPKDPGPQQTPWIPVKSPVIPNQIFDLEKGNKMTPGNTLQFEQKDPKAMLHFAPTSDTVVYTIVKDEDKTRYWSVRAWVKGDTLFENRLTSPEPYNKAKVGLSHISVDRPTTLIVWRKEVKKVKVL